MDWKDLLPYLAEQISDNCVFRYDGVGFTRELTEEQRSKINEIESEYEKLKVVGVLDAKYEFTNNNIIHFNTYLLIGDSCMPEIASFDNRGYVIFYSYVTNIDTGSSEFGDVGIIETVGLLRRIY